MAEEEGVPPTEDETAELEALLEDAPVGDEGGEGGKFSPKAILAKLTSSKKMMMLAGGGVLLLLLIAGGAAYYFLAQEEVQEVVEEEAVEVEEESEKELAKVHLYPLRPFFLPIRTLENEETGHFLSVVPSFMLSNPTLNREIDKVLPLVRKNVYSILRRKRYKDLIEKKLRTRERIKREILTAANALLLSGTGTITDVP